MRKAFSIGVVIAMAIMVFLSCVLAESSVKVEQAAPAFKLEDQFGKHWNLADLRDSVVVVVAANDKSGRAMGPWVDNLKSSYGNKIRLLGLLDLHKVPGLGRGIAKSRIRKETKDPMMLDFKGPTAKSYFANSEYPVVVVIDKDGIARDIQKTAYTESAYKKCTKAIDKAIKGD